MRTPVRALAALFLLLCAPLAAAEWGANDLRPSEGALPAAQTLANLQRLYAQLRNDTHADVFWLGRPLVNDQCVGFEYPVDRASQLQRIKATEKAALARDTVAVPIWDAIDTFPGNGRLDNWDQTWAYDCIHPTQAGYVQLAKFLRPWVTHTNVVQRPDAYIASTSSSPATSSPPSCAAMPKASRKPPTTPARPSSSDPMSPAPRTPQRTAEERPTIGQSCYLTVLGRLS